MPFCPQCNAEYKPEISVCSDCQVTLVPQLIQTEVTEYGDWYTLESVPNELAGNILQGVFWRRTASLFVYAAMKPLIMVE